MPRPPRPTPALPVRPDWKYRFCPFCHRWEYDSGAPFGWVPVSDPPVLS